MRAGRCAAMALFLLGVPSTLAAAPILIDFEGFADGDFLTTQIPGMTFNTGVVATSGVSLNEFEAPPVSGVNAVIAAGLFQIDFTNPVSTFGGFFTYLSPLVVTAFDAAGNTLGTASSLWSNNLALSGDVGSSPNEFFELAFSNISSITVSGGAFALDDLSFDDLSLQPVPEPGTLSLMLLGAAGAAVVRRRGARRIDPPATIPHR